MLLYYLLLSLCSSVFFIICQTTLFHGPIERWQIKHICPKAGSRIVLLNGCGLGFRYCLIYSPINNSLKNKQACIHGYYIQYTLYNTFMHTCTIDPVLFTDLFLFFLFLFCLFSEPGRPHLLARPPLLVAL